MLKIEVFDPPLCCSTGVCGPAPDERLAVFSANLDWLRQQGVEVRRYNLAQEPTAFTGHRQVAQILQDTDGDGLPVLLVGGQVASQGDYPSRQRLAELVGLYGAQTEQDAPRGCGAGPSNNKAGCC